MPRAYVTVDKKRTLVRSHNDLTFSFCVVYSTEDDSRPHVKRSIIIYCQTKYFSRYSKYALKITKGLHLQSFIYKAIKLGLQLMSFSYNIYVLKKQP